MSKSLSRALLRSSSLIILISSSVTLSSAAFANDPLEVVVTADRSEVPLKNTGSAITVITSEEIEKYGSKNIADVLRTVPGLTIAEAGGLGAASKVSLRGATAGASMVLLDGIRISDPSNTEGFLDFGNISVANIERIEILRGPQSALYGSDAMGGVINIITKKGARSPVREVTLEGGSYGTISARGSMSGATDKVSYSFGVNALHSDGFPRYGYRVDHPISYWEIQPDQSLSPAPFPEPRKNDPADKSGFNGNIVYHFNNDFSIETGLAYFGNRIQFDNPDALYSENVYNKNNHSNAKILNGYARAKFNAFDNQLKNQFVIFGNQTDLNIWMMEIGNGPISTIDSYPWHIGYQGRRYGFEYQGDYNVPSIGVLTFGLRNETELAQSSQEPVDDYFLPTDASQTTNSLFAQQRVSLTNNFDVTFGGRMDAIRDGQVFTTWRSTFSYRVDAWQTKFRGAVGTGAKAPSLFQRFSQYGTPELLPEESVGVEIGVDQQVTNSFNISATLFQNDYRNKIDYVACAAPTPPYNCYGNTANARAQGIEISGDLEIVPEMWRAKFSYTLMNAVNLDKDKQLYRLPRNVMSASFVYDGIRKWEFEPKLSLVGSRLDVFSERDGTISSGMPNYSIVDVTLPAYLKLDFLTRYKLNDSNDAYIRFENLTDARTEDAYNYGSAGRSVYVGWTTRW